MDRVATFLLLALGSSAATAFGTVTVGPSLVWEGDEVLVHVPFDYCEFLSARPVEVTVDHGIVAMTLETGTQISDLCGLSPPGDYVFPIAALPAGEYTVVVSSRDVFAPYPITEIGRATVAVQAARGVPALSSHALLLAAGLAFAIAAARSRWEHR